MKTEFDWFTGIASIAMSCPDEFLKEGGLQPFFINPNDPRWGNKLPRRLYHEALHFWQLASSRYMQLLIVEEWKRLKNFEQHGKVPPRSELRKTYGRVKNNEPFSVRDLIECIARFWDVHTRSPTRLLQELGDDLDGRIKEIDLIRPEVGYSSMEFDAVMLTGPDCEVYAKPYRWMLEYARMAPAVQALPKPVEQAASWAINLQFPITSFLALNTDAPIAAFEAGFKRCLEPDVLFPIRKERDKRESINLDWLDFYSFLAKGLYSYLKRINLSPWLEPWVGFGVLENEAFLDHPVYRYLRARMTSLDQNLDSMRKMQKVKYVLNPTSMSSQDMDDAMAWREAIVTEPDRWPVFSLPGQPNFRYLLGSIFAPPVIRFTDTDITATASTFPDWPWPIDSADLMDAAKDVEKRFAALEAADSAIRNGLPASAFSFASN